MPRSRALLPPRLRALRLLLPVAALALVVVVLLGAGLLVVGQFTLGGGSGASSGPCDTAGSSADAGDGTPDAADPDAADPDAADPDAADPGAAGPTTVAQLDPAQRSAAETIIGVAKGMAAPPRAWVVALATAMQESRLGRAGTDVAVDHDSLGLFQQRPSQGWGSPDQVRDPVYATRTFLARLLAVPGWDAMPVTRAAQTVQRSAFPSAYARWEPLAADLVGDLAGVTGAIRDCSGSSSGSPGDSSAGSPDGSGVATLPPEVVRTALDTAVAETGKPYVWGSTGPASFDCSGLVLDAFRAAGVILPRTSREQYAAGAHVPVAAAQPGDLLFYAYDPSDPDTIHHVVLYLGDGRIMEAQQTGVPLGVRTVSFTERGLVPLATRPGTAADPTGAVS